MKLNNREMYSLNFSRKYSNCTENNCADQNRNKSKIKRLIFLIILFSKTQDYNSSKANDHRNNNFNLNCFMIDKIS